MIFLAALMVDGQGGAKIGRKAGKCFLTAEVLPLKTNRRYKTYFKIMPLKMVSPAGHSCWEYFIGPHHPT